MWQITGRGDHGDTTLFDGTRVEKDNPIFDLIGNLDELNAFIGFGISEIDDEQYAQELIYIQVSISKMMAMIAGADQKAFADFSLQNFLEWIELQTSTISTGVRNPGEFTFPGGSKAGAVFDICRTVARRAERSAVKLYKSQGHLHSDIVPILNRLSTLFYLMRLKDEQEPKPSTD